MLFASAFVGCHITDFILWWNNKKAGKFFRWYRFMPIPVVVCALWYSSTEMYYRQLNEVNLLETYYKDLLACEELFRMLQVA